MSKIEVNTVAPQCGTTLTLGESGDTVTLGSGASQTGFGRTGTVDWQTTPKTATFTAVNGEGYFCNTTSGSFEVDLPAGVAGAIVSIQDYNNTFDSNQLTVDPNGSEKINGGTAGGFISLSTEGLGLTFVYIDATVGWRSVQSNEYSTSGSTPTFITATGGTITCCGNFKTHIFTGPGTFTVCSVGNACGSNSVDYLVVAGGGGGGAGVSGGGGAGGFRVSNSYSIPAPTMSPLSNPTGLPVSVQSYTIAVGGGGPAGAVPNNPGTDGNVSTFSTITSAGGGKGKGSLGGNGVGFAGASGGGARGAPPGGPVSSGYAGGAGNTPPVSPSQGNNGGAGYDGFTVSTNSGGGGGAGAVGGQGGCSAGGAGGAGSFIADAFIKTACAPTYGTPGPVGSTRYFSGGGGGTTCGGPVGQPVTFGVGGAGGGGAGAPNNSTAATVGTINTGGGGGGGFGNPASPGGTGGSGIVMIRYKFQ